MSPLQPTAILTPHIALSASCPKSYGSVPWENQWPKFHKKPEGWAWLSSRPHHYSRSRCPPPQGLSMHLWKKDDKGRAEFCIDQCKCMFRAFPAFNPSERHYSHQTHSRYSRTPTEAVAWLMLSSEAYTPLWVLIRFSVSCRVNQQR